MLDAQLRADGVSLASHLGATARFVAGGCGDRARRASPELVASAAACVELGYRSLKLKIAPGHDVNVVAAVRAEVGADVTVQVDANGSYTLADADHLAALDPLDVACFEQPLAPDALVDHARLAARLAARRSVSTRRSRARASRATRSSSTRARS